MLDPCLGIYEFKDPHSLEVTDGSLVPKRLCNAR